VATGLAALRDDGLDASFFEREGLVDRRRRADQEHPAFLHRIACALRKHAEREAEDRCSALERRSELVVEGAAGRRRDRGRRQPELSVERGHALERRARVRELERCRQRRKEVDAERVDAWSGLGGQIINSWSPNQLRAVSDFDTTHQFNANWIVDLPFGKGKPFAANSGGVAEAFIGGWQLSGLTRWTTGFPVTIANGATWPTNWQLSGAATGFLILGIFGQTPSANRPAPKPRSHREFPVKVLNLGSHMKRRHRREFQAMSFAPRFFVRSLERFAKTVVILKCRDKQKLLRKDQYRNANQK